MPLKEWRKSRHEENLDEIGDGVAECNSRSSDRDDGSEISPGEGSIRPNGRTSGRRDKSRSSKRKRRNGAGEEVDDKELWIVLSVMNGLVEEIEA